MIESHSAVKSRFIDTYDLMYPPEHFDAVPITRNGLFELASCVGKAVRPTEIDRHWPLGKDSLNVEEAFDVICELEEIKLPKQKSVRMPTEKLFHRLQRMDLPGDDRFFMEKYWKTFTDENGDFEIERFSRVLEDDREVFLDDQDDVRAFYHESESGEIEMKTAFR
ncbi:hypothetical protein PENTCL1PPCAC_7659 [Pristionchus entomophagus]|uniref:Uncharacterized protein n=1 Tax=Pristionchus entomophagus TaxID=358040 RepID=A0AAV5SVU2_9BILA|nr:hypothetical protein PENTCL1PPCAC_7659 [Pristionchus entomophagus]